MYIVVFVIAMVGTTGLMIIDGYMKFEHSKDNAEERAEILNTSAVGISGESFKEFSIWAAIRWNLLFPISIIILAILIWCFYFTY